MKFLICSDIHGSAKYCEMLLKAFENEKCDKMLLAAKQEARRILDNAQSG